MNNQITRDLMNKVNQEVEAVIARNLDIASVMNDRQLMHDILASVLLADFISFLHMIAMSRGGDLNKLPPEEFRKLLQEVSAPLLKSLETAHARDFHRNRGRT